MIAGVQLSEQKLPTPPGAQSVASAHEPFATRRRFQLLSVVLSFSYAVFNSIYLGRPEKRVTWETVCLAIALTLIYSAYEHVRSTFSEKDSAAEGKFAFSANRKMTVLSLVSVGIILLFANLNPAPHVYAAALDVRLKSLTTSPNVLDPSNIGKIIGAVNAASESGLKLRPKLVDAASTTVLEASRTDSSVWSAALGIVGYRSTQSRPDTSYLTRKSCFPAPDTSVIELSVEESHLLGCSEELDGIAWKNVLFEDSTVIYRGGSTKLDGVYFKNCRFVIDYTPRGQELAKALASSDSVTIDLSNH
jgi:hypothetical protein